MTSNSFIRGSWAVLIVFSSIVVSVPVIAGDLARLQQSQPDASRSVGILPSKAQPRGLSLAGIARATAEFNVTDHSGPVPVVADGSRKVQMLFATATNTFHVSEGTILYVPVWYNDDSPPVIGSFPDVTDRNAVVAYVTSSEQFGNEYSTITIDGQAFPLDERYLVAMKVPPLPDGGGTSYMVMATFVRPLKKGRHTIEISSFFSGAALIPWCQIVQFCTDSALFGATYTIIVH